MTTLEERMMLAWVAMRGDGTRLVEFRAAPDVYAELREVAKARTVDKSPASNVIAYMGVPVREDATLQPGEILEVRK